jgi:crotonobetainyl-CoA:carnitine CoA-transferase CaiB-like acyl-CoA transferase
MAGACAGLKVVIARGMPCALAGMIFADHGADAIRVEDPAGDRYLNQTGDLRIAAPTERYGALGQAGVPARFSRTPVRTERQEPEIGAHTDEVLRALGVPDEALERPRAAGTIPARENTPA